MLKPTRVILTPSETTLFSPPLDGGPGRLAGNGQVASRDLGPMGSVFLVVLTSKASERKIKANLQRA